MNENGRTRWRIPRAVLALGVVSFLTDFSSEMIYPLLPLFLAGTLGAGAVTLGLIEGLAESTASLLKIVSGVWSDRSQKRKPLIVAGYTLAGVARPLIGLAVAWPFVLLLRFLDRVGKGLRTSPRDALIADATDPAVRGRAYGFHRAMDHAGAVAGPLVAAWLISGAGLQLRDVFLFAAIPAIAVIPVLIFGVKEPPRPAQAPPKGSTLAPWSTLGADFRRLLLAVLIFTLGRSTDAFLLLRMGEAGISAGSIALLWAAHHAVKAVSTQIGGNLSDRFGPRRLILTGWIFHAAVYLFFGRADSVELLITLFLAYGIYFGLTEPSERAWVATLAPREARGTAFGWYHCTTGLAALPGSVLFGLVWQSFGAVVAFTSGSALALLAAGVLLSIRPHSFPASDGGSGSAE